MNLIEMLKNELTDGAVSSLSQKLNITPEQTQLGLSAAVPSVLAGILKKASGAGSLGALSSIFTGHRQSIKAEPENEYGDASSLLSKGSSLVSDLFGDKKEDISKEIASKTSLSAEKSQSFLTMAAPLIMGHLDKIIANNGWSMPDFIGKLFDQKSSIESHLPLGLASAFGLSNLNLPHLNQAAIPDAKAAIISESKSSSGNVLKWIIAIAIIVFIAWWFLGRKKTDIETVKYMEDTTSISSRDTMANESLAKRAAGVVAGTLSEAGDWVYNLGANKSIKLSNGTTINVGEHSSESKIISFIEDNNKSVNDTTWISLDRLYFETGKAILKPESQEQLSNIADIMKSYPKVKMKLGGYTDNTGSTEGNMTISTERANAAMKDLIGLGVSANRLKAEGYGEQHPIADNSTAEGRAQNRRIDVRITEK